MRISSILIVAAAFAANAAMPALAQDAPALDMATLDTDTSGTVSFDELAVALPDLTEDDFAAADTDGSGDLSADELAAFADMHANAG